MTCKRTKFKNYVDEVAKKKNTTKSRVRAKVEHVFRILKRVFGFDKVRYRGIAKNHHRLCANFALVNLYLHRKRLAGLAAVSASGDWKIGLRSYFQTPPRPLQATQNRMPPPDSRITSLRRASQKRCGVPRHMAKPRLFGAGIDAEVVRYRRSAG